MEENGTVVQCHQNSHTTFKLTHTQCVHYICIYLGTLEKVVACMTLQITWMGMQMRIASTTSSPTTSDVCGIGDLS